MKISNRIKHLLFVLFPVLMAVLGGCISTTYPTFSHQGRLLDASGNPVADGTYPVSYKLYHAATGSTAVYTQDTNITVQDGYFTSSFGASDVDPKIFWF